MGIGTAGQGVLVVVGPLVVVDVGPPVVVGPLVVVVAGPPVVVGPLVVVVAGPPVVVGPLVVVDVGPPVVVTQISQTMMGHPFTISIAYPQSQSVGGIANGHGVVVVVTIPSTQEINSHGKFSITLSTRYVLPYSKDVKELNKELGEKDK